MTENQVLSSTDEWITRLKKLFTSTADENKDYVQKHIELLEKLREQAERVKNLEKRKTNS